MAPPPPSSAPAADAPLSARSTVFRRKSIDGDAKDRRLSKDDTVKDDKPGGRVRRDRRLSKEGDTHLDAGASDETPSGAVALAVEANAAANQKTLLVAGEPDEDKAGDMSKAKDGSDGHRFADGSMLAVYSCRGRDGSRHKINQDCASMAHPLGGDASSALLCVYDGHGPEGHHVSNQVLRSMHFELDTRCTPEKLQKDPPSALTAAFESVQSQLTACTEGGAAAAAPSVDASESGACSLVAYFRGNKLWVANAGDCCCVLATSIKPDKSDSKKGGSGLYPIPLSAEHKCDLPSETKRIEALGGWVRAAEYDEIGLVTPARMYRQRGEANRSKGPGLAISRSIGDLNAVSIGMTPTPEVTSRTLQISKSEGTKAEGGEDAFLIMASDGIWEFISAQDAVEIVAPFYEDRKDGSGAAKASKALIERAKAEWLTEGSYRDDISVVVIFLPTFVRALEAGA